MGEGRNITCTDGLMLPCWRPLVNVPIADRIGRGLIYSIVLMYLFIGVSIISDRFMAAIEVITSQEREVRVKRPNGERNIVVVRVWNETVANLTLMALGSSAPEILLSVIEIWAKEFEAGELGPGTIVGSAAYNLFVIIAICVSVIPNGEVRKIKHLRVFFVTAAWSVFAYVWLYIILAVTSPGIVEVWEAVLTFMFFPTTVLTAYAADRRMYKYVRKSYRMNVRGVIVQAEGADSLEMGQTELDLEDVQEDAKQEYVTTLKELRRQHPNCDLDSLERMAHELLLNRGPKSRAFYRIQATRKLMGSGDLLRRISERAQSDLSEVKAEIRRESGTAEFNPSGSRVFFEPSKYTVLESCGRFEVRVARSGDVDAALSVQYCTEDGTATSGSDYIEAKGTLHFGPGEKEKRIVLEVIDDDVFEADEHFYVRLSSAQPPGSLMSPTLATVIILDDDHGGLFKFAARDHELVESVGVYELKVVRCSGARGRVVIPYWTEDGTAKAGKEYEAIEGEVVFENNESDSSPDLLGQRSSKMKWAKPQLNGKSHQLPQIMAILAGSVAGLSEGMLFAWTSPAIPELLADNSTNISFEEASYFTVIPSISMAITAPLFSLLIDVIGRKKVLLLVSVPLFIGWILTGFAKSTWVFYLARFIAGIASAALFAACPIYVCEIAEPKVRGTWGNMVAISTYAGVFLINIIGSHNDIPTTAWICACIPVFHIVTFSFMPESPYYLLMKGRVEEAKKSLKLLRWTNDVDEELLTLKADVTRQISESGTIKELFSIDSNRKALVMCLLMRFAQQFSGLSAFELYTQYFFQESGGDLSHTVSAIIFTGFLTLSVTLAAFVVERFGRRPLMIFSCFGCGIILAIEAVYFSLREFTDLELSNFGWIPLVGMLAYIVVCSTGIGILPTLVLGEVFSASIKGKATSISNIGIACGVLIIPKLFQTLTYNFGMFAPFYFFSFCCMVFGTLSCFYVIETKGKTLEEIQQEFKGNRMR